MKLGHALRPLWSLEEGLVLLNHGAFGATPLELQVEQTRWRQRMELNPPRFFMDELPGLIREAAVPLAAFVGADVERLGFVENASSAMASALASIDLAPGDEVLTTSHVYNAVRLALRHVASRTGAQIIEAPVPMPVAGDAAVLAAIVGAITARTRLIVVDHVVSASAVIFPVKAIVDLAHERGIPVIIDGAHAPGMIDLDVDAIGADIYLGNCHKWLCAPKGAGFIVVSPAMRDRVHPTVISHAYGQGFAAEFGKIGTRDPSSWLTVPAAIAFHGHLGGAALRHRNREVAREMAAEIVRSLRSEIGAPESHFGSMVTVRLPTSLPADWPTAKALHDDILDRLQIETLILPFQGSLWLRISAQAYNEVADVAPLAETLPAMLARQAAA